MFCKFILIFYLLLPFINATIDCEKCTGENLVYGKLINGKWICDTKSTLKSLKVIEWISDGEDCLDEETGHETPSSSTPVPFFVPTETTFSSTPTTPDDVIENANEPATGTSLPNSTGTTIPPWINFPGVKDPYLLINSLNCTQSEEVETLVGKQERSFCRLLLLHGRHVDQADNPFSGHVNPMEERIKDCIFILHYYRHCRQRRNTGNQIQLLHSEESNRWFIICLILVLLFMIIVIITSIFWYKKIRKDEIPLQTSMEMI